jgi:hypothetical protein
MLAIFYRFNSYECRCRTSVVCEQESVPYPPHPLPELGTAYDEQVTTFRCLSEKPPRQGIQYVAEKARAAARALRLSSISAIGAVEGWLQRPFKVGLALHTLLQYFLEYTELILP